MEETEKKRDDVTYHEKFRDISEIISKVFQSHVSLDTIGYSQLLCNRPFATNDHMVQNPPYWRASSLLFPHWDIETKASQA